MNGAGRLRHLAHDPRSGLWLAYIVMVGIRFPASFRFPLFYAEEAVVYFSYAEANGVVDSLFEPHLGYLALFANFGAVLAAAVPLKYSVLVVTVLGFVAPSACAWLVIEADVRRLQRLAALAVIVFTFTMSFEWATTIHAQFWFAVAVILMIAVEPRNRRAAIGQYVLAGIAGLSGGVAALAAPAYVLRAVRLRETRDVVIGSILSATAVLQLALGASRDGVWNVGEFVVISFLKLAFYPLTGQPGGDFGLEWFQRWPELPVAAIFAVLLAAWVVFVVVSSQDSWRLVAATGIFAGLASIYSAVPPYVGLASPTLGTRYSVVGVVPVLVALAMSFHGTARLNRVVIVVVVALAVGTGVDSGLTVTSIRLGQGAFWEASVARFEQDPGRTLPTDGHCNVSVNQARQQEGFSVTRSSSDEASIDFELTVGHLDRDHDAMIFVWSLETQENLTSEGWQPISGFLLGGQIGRCHVGPSVVSGLTESTNPTIAFRIPREVFVDIDERVDVIEIGYGRDFDDALAKDIFTTFEVCDLLGVECGAQKSEA